MALIGIPRHHHILRYIDFEFERSALDPFADDHVFFRVGHARGHAKKHRGIVLLAYRKGLFYIQIGLRRPGRLKEGKFAEHAHPPGVLLILRGVQPWIVAHHHDKSGQDARIGGGHERIHGHVETYML